MRAKIIDGVFTPSPRKIRREIDGEQYTTYNPTDEMLDEQGWLTVVETDPPDDAPEGYYYAAGWAEDDGQIVQTWTLVEDPNADDISAEEALEILTGGEADEED